MKSSQFRRAGGGLEVPERGQPSRYRLLDCAGLTLCFVMDAGRPWMFSTCARVPVTIDSALQSVMDRERIEMCGGREGVLEGHPIVRQTVKRGI